MVVANVLAIRRISIFLFLSSFLGFIAAILDLGQILSRGVANVVNRPGLGDVADFIQAREVLLSFSAGFIFLFFWTFVGLRPIGLPASPRNVTTSSATSTSSGHCGSWTRWGVIGLTLKWLSLLSCILIAILQIVWRVSPQHNRYAELYVTSGILETTISAIFILKIFLNLYLCPATLRRPVMIAHIVPLLALLVNAGLGMGNLVLCERILWFFFSPSTDLLSHSFLHRDDPRSISPSHCGICPDRVSSDRDFSCESRYSQTQARIEHRKAASCGTREIREGIR